MRAFLRAHLEATARGEALPPFAEPARAMAIDGESACAPGVTWESLGAARQDMLVFSPPERWAAPAPRARAVALEPIQDLHAVVLRANFAPARVSARLQTPLVCGAHTSLAGAKLPPNSTHSEISNRLLDKTLPIGGRSRLPKDALAYGVLENGAFVAWAAAARMGGIAYLTVETQPAHRGRGLATACLIALTRALQACGRTAVYVCERDNLASQKVALGAGYALCGAWRRW